MSLVAIAIVELVTMLRVSCGSSGHAAKPRPEVVDDHRSEAVGHRHPSRALVRLLLVSRLLFLTAGRCSSTSW